MPTSSYRLKEKAENKKKGLPIGYGLTMSLGTAGAVVAGAMSEKKRLDKEIASRSPKPKTVKVKPIRNPVYTQNQALKKNAATIARSQATIARSKDILNTMGDMKKVPRAESTRTGGGTVKVRKRGSSGIIGRPMTVKANVGGVAGVKSGTKLTSKGTSGVGEYRMVKSNAPKPSALGRVAGKAAPLGVKIGKLGVIGALVDMGSTYKEVKKQTDLHTTGQYSQGKGNKKKVFTFGGRQIAGLM